MSRLLPGGNADPPAGIPPGVADHRLPKPGLFEARPYNQRKFLRDGERACRALRRGGTDRGILGGQRERLTCGVSLPSRRGSVFGAKPTAGPGGSLERDRPRGYRRRRYGAYAPALRDRRSSLRSRSNAISRTVANDERRESRRARARSRESERVDRREKARNGRWRRWEVAEVEGDGKGRSARRLHFLYSVLPPSPPARI